MAGGGITIGGNNGTGGVVTGNIWVPTESGLQSSGFLDRLQAAMDNRAQYQGTLAGLAPALQASGVPVQQPRGFFDQLLGTLGLGGQQPQQSSPQLPTSSPIDRSGAPAPTMGGSAPPAQPTSAGGMAGPLTGNALASVIGQTAQKYKIDPMTALRVASAEGGFASTAAGDGGSSFGPFQLHYGNLAPGGNSVRGLGDDFTRDTGLDARDPRNAAAAIDYALRDVAQNGWSKFHGAAKAGIGQWDGIGGAPAQATAYAPSGGGSDGPSLRPPTAAGSANATPMPIATSSPGTRQMPQPPAPDVAGAQPAPAAQASADGNTAHVGQVLGPLLANPQTRPVGQQLWQAMLQKGAGGNGLQLPAGMTPDALAQMISTPQTMQMGLGIWQKALYPGITSIEPNRAVFKGTQYLGQTPSAPMEVPEGGSVYDPNTRQTVAANPPKLQATEIGRDAYGQPQYGAFNPRGGAVTPFQAGQGPGTGAPAVGADGQPLSGDAFLQTLPPALASQVKAAAEGRVKLPTGMSASSPMAQRMRAAVLQYDPSFDQAGVDARFETRKDFASGDAAKTITAGGTAIQHLNDLAGLIDKLGNVDTSIPGNNYINAFKNSAAGSSAAGANLAAFNSIASKYTEEATKFYRGSGGTEADISRDLLNVDPNMSPTQLKAAIGAQLPLLRGKIQALQDRWHASMGAGAPDFPIVSPATQSAMDGIEGITTPRGAASPSLPVAGASQAGAGSIPTIRTPADARGLPKGTRFRTPDGREFVR